MNSRRILPIVLLVIAASAIGQSTQVEKVELEIDCAFAVQVALQDVARATKLSEDDSGFKSYMRTRLGVVECSLLNRGEAKIRLRSTEIGMRGGAISYLIDREKMTIKEKLVES